MGYSAKVGSFNIDTAKTVGQTQAITGLGFQPKIVLFFWSGSTATTDTVAGGSINLGFGAMTSSTNRGCVDAIVEDAQASSDSLGASNMAAIMRAYTDTGTLDGSLDASSLDADGFTVIYDDAFTQAYRISYIALGGTDLTNVYIGSGATKSTTGTQAYTGVGFQPTAVGIFAVSPSTSATNTVTSALFSLGLASGSSNQNVITFYDRTAAATMETAGYGYSGEIYGRHGTGDTLNYRAALTAFDADGFTLNFLETAATARYFIYFALKGGQYSVGSLTTRTDGNDITVSGLGFSPVGLLFTSANRAASTQDTPTAHARASIGAATSTSNRAVAAASDEDNLADSETAYGNYDSAVYAYVADDAISGLMDIKSIDSGGFTAVMDDTDPSGCFVGYLAIGATAVSSAAGPLLNGHLVKRGILQGRLVGTYD